MKKPKICSEYLFFGFSISSGPLDMRLQKFYYGGRYHSGAIIGSLVGASSQYITVYTQYCMLS